MTVETRGMKELQSKLTRLDNEFAAGRGRNDAYTAMKRSLYLLVGEMANYPQLASSTYRRTGTLGRKWVADWRAEHIRNEGVDLVGRVGNNTEYAPLVQSRQFQTAVHRRHGWITDVQAMENQRENIEDEFDSTLSAKIREVGL